MTRAKLALVALLTLTGCTMIPPVRAMAFCEAEVYYQPERFPNGRQCPTPAEILAHHEWMQENERQWKAAHPDGCISASCR